MVRFYLSRPCIWPAHAWPARLLGLFQRAIGAPASRSLSIANQVSPLKEMLTSVQCGAHKTAPRAGTECPHSAEREA